MLSQAQRLQAQRQAQKPKNNGAFLKSLIKINNPDWSAEQIEARFTEIQDGLGGAEALAARMAEFGVTEESLRRDIENEFLIQGLFDANIDSANLTASEEEIFFLYNQAGGEAAGLPPMADIRDQIEAQVIFDKEQELISAFIEELRADATIEVLI